MISLGAGLRNHSVRPPRTGHLSKHRQWLPRYLIAIEHADVIEGNISGWIEDLVVSSAVYNHKLMTCTLNAEVDHAGIDAWARWLAVEVFDFYHLERKSWVIFVRARVFVIVGWHDLLIGIVERLEKPEIVQSLSSVVLPTKYVESFVIRLLLSVLFCSEQSFIAPHNPALS